MKILIVDDSELARALLRRTLEENVKADALELVEATNGDEAMKALGTKDVSLVFLDWNMPVVDGLSFVRQARADGVRIPIIMITAVSDEAKIYEACQAGVTDYIEKPIRGPELWARIEGYVR